MAKFFSVSMTVTEVTIQNIAIEAETEEEARAIVEEYNFDNSECTQTDSLEWSVSAVVVGGSWEA